MSNGIVRQHGPLATTCTQNDWWQYLGCVHEYMNNSNGACIISSIQSKIQNKQILQHVINNSYCSIHSFWFCFVPTDIKHQISFLFKRWISMISATTYFWVIPLSEYEGHMLKSLTSHLTSYIVSRLNNPYINIITWWTVLPRPDFSHMTCQYLKSKIHSSTKESSSQ